MISGAGHRPFLSNDLDPDSHFYDNFVNHCDYFVEDQFNKMLNSQISCAPSFSLFHLNIRSLESNLSNLTNLLSTLNIEFSVIGITETWLKNSEHSVDIEGYNFFHKHRVNKIGGGVGLYLSDCFTSEIRTDLIFHDDDDVAESLFIEVCIPHGKNIIIEIIYRPPNQNANSFLSKYNDIIGKIYNESKTCYIIIEL